MTDQDMAQGLRVALYSHDSLGLGHSRRNLAIADALAARLPGLTERRVSGLLITGERTATSYPCPEGWDWVVVPGVRKATGEYVPRTLNVGMRRVLSIRSSIIEGALMSFNPHLVIVDRHPFGIDGELEQSLASLRASRPGVKIVLGLREVLDDPATARREWEAVGIGRVLNTFDELWVYGDRAVHDPVASGEIPAAFAPRLRYTGFISKGRRCDDGAAPASRLGLLTMVGGGSDGGRLAAAAAAAPVPAGYNHLVVTGPQMPAEDRERVRAVAGPSVTVVDSVPDGLVAIRGAAAVTAMGGYNTVAEVLGTTTPALIVPRTAPRTEQLIRARSIARTGAIDTLHPADLTPQALGEWFALATGSGDHAARQARARGRLQLDGTENVALLAAELSETTRTSAATAKELLHAAV